MKRSTLLSASLALTAVATFAATALAAGWVPDDQNITLEPASAVEPVDETDRLAETGASLDEPVGPVEDTTDTVDDRTGTEPVASTDHKPGGSGPGDVPSGEDEGDAATGSFSIAFDERSLSVIGPNGTANSFAWELDRARGEIITDVAVRPGTSALELDAIVTVLRGELPYLYELTVRNGTDAVFADVPAHLQPQTALEAVITPHFTPDGRSVLWAEPTGDGVSLRSIGWDDGAGTGRAADDNATFALGLPADVRITGFQLAGDDTAGATATAWTVMFTDGLGESHELEMERQSDGALTVRS